MQLSKNGENMSIFECEEIWEILHRKRAICRALIVLFLVSSAPAFAQSTQFPMLENYLP